MGFFKRQVTATQERERLREGVVSGEWVAWPAGDMTDEMRSVLTDSSDFLRAKETARERDLVTV